MAIMPRPWRGRAPHAPGCRRSFLAAALQIPDGQADQAYRQPQLMGGGKARYPAFVSPISGILHGASGACKGMIAKIRESRRTMKRQG